ncbi:hypothetical protein [Daejeonella oryzae]|uniref:hypothetical protein n=1 Tax=Daejeonella oryzae TaxID=1122943 RepID=UPI0004132DAA|nr:hypothetical protein [Daejeonella oryzae]
MKLKICYLKNFLVASVIISSSVVSYAQNADLKEKKVLINDGARLIYHVKENNIKEGSYYIKNAKSDQFLVRGAYTNNKRSGNWYFYNEAGKPESIYSYQQNRLAFIDSTLLEKITINIPGQDKTVIENTQIPVMLSPINLFLAEMSNNIIIPEEHFKPNEELLIKIKSVIGVTGEPKYFLIYTHNGKEIEEQIKLKRSTFTIDWIPAMYEKNPIKSEFIVNTAISGNTNSSDGHRRFRWNE